MKASFNLQTARHSNDPLQCLQLHHNSLLSPSRQTRLPNHLQRIRLLGYLVPHSKDLAVGPNPKNPKKNKVANLENAFVDESESGAADAAVGIMDDKSVEGVGGGGD